MGYHKVTRESKHDLWAPKIKDAQKPATKIRDGQKPLKLKDSIYHNNKGMQISSRYI